jgi:hypothetical protein
MEKAPEGKGAGGDADQRLRRSVRDREVVGSNPIAPINRINKLWLPKGSHFIFTTLSIPKKN